MTRNIDRQGTPRPQAAALAAIDAVNRREPTGRSKPRRPLQEVLGSAEVLLLPLADVRRVGPQTAIVWAAIQGGYVSYGDLVTVTGLTRREVRASWAHLSRAGYPLPLPTISPAPRSN